ncbi:MAG TPA: NUDIX hydrolase [Puia sp.]|nr:NUDIX hydrolase [Puia sp.]
MATKNDLRWKTLSSKYLFTDDWLTLRADTCETPQGKIVSPYYVYEFPDWVMAVALTTDGRFILERQYRHALGVVSIELPGGCVDAGDVSLEAALRRELMEETGYGFGSVEFLGKVCANPSTNSNWAHLYLATGGRLEQEQRLDPNEEIEVCLYTFGELKQLLRENGVVQSMHMAAFFYAFQRLGYWQL